MNSDCDLCIKIRVDAEVRLSELSRYFDKIKKALIELPEAEACEEIAYTLQNINPELFTYKQKIG